MLKIPQLVLNLRFEPRSLDSMLFLLSQDETIHVENGFIEPVLDNSQLLVRGELCHMWII